MTKKLTKTELIADYEKKVAQLTEGIDTEYKTKERYQKMVNVWRELQTLKVEGIKKGTLKPEFEHQKNPRFWELMAIDLQFKVDDETATQNGQLEQYDYRIEMLTKELELIKTELSKAKGE